MGVIKAVPPTIKPSQKHAIQLLKYRKKGYLKIKKSLFPTQRGEVGPIRIRAGRTKGESRMIENKPKRKPELKP